MASARIAPIPDHDGYYASTDGTIYSAWTGSGRGARVGIDLRPLRAISEPDGRTRVNLRRNQGRDKEAHGTSNHGERNGSARLTAASVKEIRRRAARGETHRSLAASFGVSRSTIQQAVAGITWKKVA